MKSVADKIQSEATALKTSTKDYADHRTGWLPIEAALYLEKTKRWEIVGKGPKGYLLKRIAK